MKRTLITTAIVAAAITLALFVFNKLVSKDKSSNVYAEAKKGDYIARLDRTEYDNTLKDAIESLTTLKANLEMKILDTTVTLTDLRDDIKNQQFVVEEAHITLAESKYEPPATIRQAEISLNKAQRGLEQLKKTYELRKAQSLADITQTKLALENGTEQIG